MGGGKTEGFITVIQGPSGAGKSTLLRMCNRLEVPDSGQIFFRGTDVTSMSPTRLRQRVGMVFQTPVVFGGTVRDNLRAAKKLDDAACVTLLQRVSLRGDWLGRKAADLSGGEAQRLCIARALTTSPEVLLMDEPTAHLDEEAALEIEALARALADSGVHLIWVSHDRAQASRLGDERLELRDGNVLRAGP